MIQRIQTIWLFLAALLSGLLFINGLTGYVYQADVPSGFAGIVVQKLTVTSHFPTLILAVMMTLVPLVAIFLFRNRRLQQRLAFGGIIACMGFMSVNLMRIANYQEMATPAPVNGSYMPASIIPILVLVLLVLAILAIRKDDKLVRSMDRLR